MDKTDAVVVIPARFAASRLPGKPLREIAGVPMIRRTALQALKSGLPVWVAYDDTRIAAALDGVDVSLAATREDHDNGSERLSEVVTNEAWDDEQIVVNVQGDEPLLPPALIARVAETLAAAPWAGVATLAAPFDAAHSPAAATAVKVVCDRQGRALYFSRSAIPYVRDADGVSGDFPYLRHIGIYAYRVSVLKRYPSLCKTPLEQAEKLEQLRFIEHGIDVAVGVVDEVPPPGVDCEEDIQRVEAVLASAR
ncbi:3-deoxy-manno-octulosonate cytidylyltransferase [Suttonella sp. R2A3]|uniref:3-deoxy-manno-octulosonate cytidylyltransferase n=1 Tax=Suttonella sp. R2A3 TaxID=2908648 RepID=UPI001F27CD50|nr:3-deoxy-manno-octulosonate cytidylyltransferase [Suttonella sp. R2A3]UJF24309.1 3-deoxy-manno-octulosonate cytidylyltransferase [Suttonella sp. R2A3]